MITKIKNATYYVQTDFCYNCLQGRNVNFFVHVIKDGCQDVDLLKSPPLFSYSN